MSLRMSRRGLMVSGAAIACGGVVAGGAEPAAVVKPAMEVPGEDYKIKNGRIKHSVMCSVMGIAPDVAIEAAVKMGMPAVEAIPAKAAAKAKEAGLKIGYIGAHGFVKGPLDPANHAECETKLKAGIDAAVLYGSQNVITFTGFRVAGISDEQAKKNCVELWKKVMPYAEEKKINLVLEILNTRDDTHPMKGHPGYYGNDTDLCIELIKKVDSPRMKLLFDIYHVQIMNGDVIRRIRQYKEYIGHVHCAGVPGRVELTEDQEIYYPAVMRALVEAGYSGFVAQEFIPTWPDKLAALRHAVRVCDV